MRLPARVAPAATAVRRVRAVVRPPRQAAVFDAALYLRENPDVAAVAARDPLRHYLSHGWREGRRPNVWFDPAAYIAAYPDVAAQDVDPLLHYVLHGKQEGRSAGVGGTVPDAAPPVEQRGDRTSGLSVEDRVRPYFDADFYAAANPDVAASGVDPFGHFLRSGWAEGRNPSRTFDVGHYLADNPDVSAAGLNPLVHYATSGVEEGRQLRPPLSPAQRQLRAAVPPRTRALAWAGGADLSPALSRDELAEALSDLVGTADDVVMSVSHDHYPVTTGGVQQLLHAEQAVLNEAGLRYLHLAPAAPLPLLADRAAARNFRLVVALDGVRVGVVTADELTDRLAALHASGTVFDAVVHQLMGHAPELVVELLAAAGVDRPVVWAHDFFSLCSNYALLRNGLEFCGAPPVTSPACGICCYGPERPDHLRRMHDLYAALEPDVLAPSAFALALWGEGGFAHAEARVQPLARLVDAPEAPPLAPPDGRPMRVAHLGATSYLKGWPAFEALALALADDDRYEFLQLGLPGDAVLPTGVRSVPVRVHGGDPGAMVEALAASSVDVVVNWSLAAETFSFTAHEALAAGAFMVVREGEGNVWPTVQAAAPQQAVQARTVDELVALFRGPELGRLLAASPRRRRLLLPTAATADPLLRRHVRRRNARAGVTP